MPLKTASFTGAERPQQHQPIHLTSESRQIGKHLGSLRPKFANCEGFHKALRSRAKAYFSVSGPRTRDIPAMYRKTAIILAWCAMSYLLLLFWASVWWQALILATSLGLAMAAIGFNIQHDGGHSAYSNHRWVNKLMSMTMDLIGASSYMWKQDHNIIHHTYSNITGHDGDIDLGILGRLSPHQPIRGFHRYQHIYLWALYGFITTKWHLFDDFNHLFRGEIDHARIRRPKKWDLLVLLSGKAVFFTLAFVIPMTMFPWYIVLGVYLFASYVQGVVMSVVFQLAHVLEEADFPLPKDNDNRMEEAWAVHQLQTTVNFAMKSRLIGWYTGGLNFQIEHHLFPQVCHLNYPGLSIVVREVCADYGLNYAYHDSLGEAIKSHYQWLKRLGQPTETV